MSPLLQDYNDAVERAKKWLKETEPRVAKLCNEPIAAEPKVTEICLFSASVAKP
jgi:hypothetical protein